MKYLIYCRKSSESEDRQVLSIPAQISELKELAKRNGIEIVGTLTESQSAKAPGRPIFNDMLAKIHEGQAEGILCWKLDRLARNPVDGGQIQWMLQGGSIKHIMTPERDYKTGDNVLMMSVELGMANQYVLDLSKNIKRGNRERVRRGLPSYPAPVGYINVDGHVEKDPDRFDLIRKIWDMALTGEYTVAELTRIANEEWGLVTLKRKRVGGKPLCKSMMHRLLRRPFYYGEFTQYGELHIGDFESMITKGEFDKVQAILKLNGYRKPEKHEFAYTGMIKCGSCGGQITAEEKDKYFKGTNRLAHYVYYRCSKRKKGLRCNEKAVTVDDLEKQIDKSLESITISEKFKDWALKYLNELNDKEIDDRTVIYKSIQSKYNQKQKELDSLTKMRCRELIDDDEYLRQKDELMGEINKLKSKLNLTEDRAKEWLELTEKVFIFARYARHWYKNGDLQQKRVIAQTLGLNFTLKDKKLSFQAQKPFEIIANADKNSNWWSWGDSNSRPKAKTRQVVAIIP